MEKIVYHGGGANKPGFSSGGGSSGITSKWVTLPWTLSENLNTNDVVPAPAEFGWQNPTQGWFFGLAYVLRELHILYGDYTTFNPGMGVTFQLRQRIADGSGAVSSLVVSRTTTFPNTGGGVENYFGDALTGLNITIPSGYELYGLISARSANDVDDISVWGQFERNLE